MHIETADESICSTELVIAHIKSKGLPELLIPVVTPRFVSTFFAHQVILH